MARFLSPEWFAEVAAVRAAPRRGRRTESPLVLEQVVRDAPDGEVRYRVVVTAGGAYIEPPSSLDSRAAPDLTIACDWATATELAQGTLSAQAALMAGRLRVSGNLARLSGRAADLVGRRPRARLCPAPDHLLSTPWGSPCWKTRAGDSPSPPAPSAGETCWIIPTWSSGRSAPAKWG